MDDYGERGEYWQRRVSDTGDVRIIAGCGARLAVERDALVVRHGLTHYPQEPVRETWDRGMHKVKRLVLLSPSGSLSIDALHWLADQDVSLTILDRDGANVATFNGETVADAHLRRLQYTIDPLPIARLLIADKLSGQQTTISTLATDHAALETIARYRHMLPYAADANVLRTLEAQAAHSYFAAWMGTPVHWVKADAGKVPSHWHAIRARTSPLSTNETARNAVDPVNAMLNYGYGVLESQCSQALAAFGFDVSCGVLHADRYRRHSLVYDLMEPFRPTVDRMILDMVSSTTLHRGDVLSLSDGRCRLHPTFARVVAQRCRLPERDVHDYARRLRATFTWE